jgi:conjugal transfer ATP-binding protein TraC
MCSQSALGPYELSQLRIHIESVWLDAQVAHRTPSITDLAESLKNNCMLGGPNPRVGDEFDSEYQSRIAAMSHEERARYCDPRIRDLGVQLYQFTEDGPYGRFFNGRTNVQFKSNLIVLELEALKRNKHLQSVMLLIVLQLIAHEVYSGDPALKKLILLDEAWQLLKAGEASADFIEELYRRARKAGAAVCTATQSILDYDTSPAARAALANADCVFLLRQKKESIEGLVQSKKLVLNEHDLSLVRSVTKKDGYYSEAYIKIGDLPGAVGRLILDPFSLLLYSTAPVDKEAIAAYRRRGLSLADAIQSVLRDRGVTDSVALRLQSTELQEAA